MLDAKALETLRQSMQSRLAALREEIRATLIRNDAEQYLEVADEVRDLGAEAFATLIVDVGLADVERDLIEVRALEQALRRLEQGNYGTCEACGRPIGYERLKAEPSAVRCVECQRLYEKTHFQKYGRTL
jgi:DnaK suppressor protein